VNAAKRDWSPGASLFIPVGRRQKLRHNRLSKRLAAASMSDLADARARRDGIVGVKLPIKQLE
jgi:hypothetical protein